MPLVGLVNLESLSVGDVTLRELRGRELRGQVPIL
jgi:hypothetical protein